MPVIIGSTSISKIKNQDEMDAFISSLGLSSDTVVIKPNWVDALFCSHTGAKVLDMVFTALKDKRKVIVESYTFWRTDKMAQQGKKEDYFPSSEATIQTGKKHWDFFKKQDKWFLKSEGLDKVFKKHNVDYINITNEVWSGKTAPAKEIRKLTESQFGNVSFPEFYEYVPEELYKTRGASFLSFSKAKMDKFYGVSLAIKNMFGLIPDPCRAPTYHKNDDEHLAQAIVDINKIYKALFDVSYIIDGVFAACEMDFDTNTTIPYENWGVILGGKNGLEVDKLGTILLTKDNQMAMKDMEVLYEKTFGEFKKNSLGKIPESLKLRK